uniref:Uncharacterized protein n=1 Tax=Anguilla anguilla TaxID=7936 RepID=A0A0E9PQU6_ANGAN
MEFTSCYFKVLSPPPCAQFYTTVKFQRRGVKPFKLLLSLHLFGRRFYLKLRTISAYRRSLEELQNTGPIRYNIHFVSYSWP